MGIGRWSDWKRRATHAAVMAFMVWFGAIMLLMMVVVSVAGYRLAAGLLSGTY